VSKCLLPAIVLALCIGCRQDMQIQPKYVPLGRTWFFPDGRMARPIPPGTIALDEVDIDPAVATGSADGAFLTTIPLPVTASLLERGRDRYNIYCSPCHAPDGGGDGLIARRGFKIPADLNGERVRNAPPGYVYSVIVNGFGAMQNYSYQIKDARDRWAIVAYIRALELSRAAPLDAVPPDAKRQLEQQP
jgi:mono/diheme cytochrome c family protein